MNRCAATYAMTVIVALIWTAPRAHAAPCTYEIRTSPERLGFAPQEIGVFSAPKTVTITNASDPSCDFTDLGLTFSGPGNSDYQIDSTSCAGSLNAGESCTADIVFSPIAERDDYNAAFRAIAQSGTVAATTALSVGSAGALMLLPALTADDDSGCNAAASTGAAAKRPSGPAALGLAAVMGLTLATAAVRRRARKRG